jgi:hypothetical protein
MRACGRDVVGVEKLDGTFQAPFLNVGHVAIRWFPLMTRTIR